MTENVLPAELMKQAKTAKDITNLSLNCRIDDEALWLPVSAVTVEIDKFIKVEELNAGTIERLSAQVKSLKKQLREKVDEVLGVKP